MRRYNWTPTTSSLLCEVDFESSQFENQRANGWKKLKSNVIPTLFDILNPPPVISSPSRKSIYKQLNNLGLDEQNAGDDITTNVGGNKTKNNANYGNEDACPILKNLKSAMLKQIMYLPETFVEQENIPSNTVNGVYLKNLWILNISKGLERFLHHLKAENIDPNNLQKMNADAVVQFFSPETARALMPAVEIEMLPRDALMTVRFNVVIYGRFSVLSSQERKMSITARNCDEVHFFTLGY